jgi:SMI1-KNR4 cell-wall
MEITPSTIWQIPAYLPYVHPKLLPRTVLLAERQLKVKVPLDYLVLLEFQNGGLVRFVHPDTPHSMFWGIGPELPSVLWHWGDEIVPCSTWFPQDVRRLVPFDGSAYSYLCFDYRGCEFDGEPQVTFVELESKRERPIATSFTQFLSQLAPLPTSHTLLGVTDHRAMQEIAAELARRAGIEPEQALTHGFEYRKLAFGSDAFVWISANLVPRAYDKPLYPELSSLLTEFALRFPEYPHIDTLLECSTAAVERTCELCRAASIDTIRIQ